MPFSGVPMDALPQSLMRSSPDVNAIAANAMVLASLHALRNGLITARASQIITEKMRAAWQRGRMSADLWLVIIGLIAVAFTVVGAALGWGAGYDAGWRDSGKELPELTVGAVPAGDVFMTPQLANWVAPEPTRLARPAAGETDTAWMRRLTDDFITRIEKGEISEENHEADA